MESVTAMTDCHCVHTVSSRFFSVQLMSLRMIRSLVTCAEIAGRAMAGLTLLPATVFCDVCRQRGGGEMAPGITRVMARNPIWQPNYRK